MATGGGRFETAGHREMFDDVLGRHGARRVSKMLYVVQTSREIISMSPFQFLFRSFLCRVFIISVSALFFFNPIFISLECHIHLMFVLPFLNNFRFCSFTLTLSSIDSLIILFKEDNGCLFIPFDSYFPSQLSSRFGGPPLFPSLRSVSSTNVARNTLRPSEFPHLLNIHRVVFEETLSECN